MVRGPSLSIPAQIIDSSADWQSQLRDVITSRQSLLAALDLDTHAVGDSGGAEDGFALKVPRGFVAKMRRGDPRDPLLLQVLSSHQEMHNGAGFTHDPVGENGAVVPQRGIIHKYHGRALLIVSGACAVNCRYCFRRHFPYQGHQNSRAQWHQALQYIHADHSITEVILSGGDPLIATDAQLAQLVEQIAAINHVKRLRIHSRLPIVIPARITDTLLTAITHTSLQTIMVLHCNHANEIDALVAAASAKLRARHITTLNQAVLLRGVNDSSAAQIALNETLFTAGILPYYLHLLDKVKGATHFDVPQSRARELMQQVARHLPGYMVPQLVKEVAGAAGKTPV